MYHICLDILENIEWRFRSFVQYSFSEDWDLGIFDCILGKKILFVIGDGALTRPQILENESPEVIANYPHCFT